MAARLVFAAAQQTCCVGVSTAMDIAVDVQARQLESAVRMAQARARLELREVVTADDAWVSICYASSQTQGC